MVVENERAPRRWHARRSPRGAVAARVSADEDASRRGQVVVAGHGEQVDAGESGGMGNASSAARSSARATAAPGRSWMEQASPSRALFRSSPVKWPMPERLSGTCRWPRPRWSRALNGSAWGGRGERSGAALRGVSYRIFVSGIRRSADGGRWAGRREVGRAGGRSGMPFGKPRGCRLHAVARRPRKRCARDARGPRYGRMSPSGHVRDMLRRAGKNIGVILPSRPDSARLHVDMSLRRMWARSRARPPEEERREEILTRDDACRRRGVGERYAEWWRGGSRRAIRRVAPRDR